MNKKWQIYDTQNEKVEELTKNYGINPLLATILVNRGITKKEDIRLFFRANKSRLSQSIFNDRHGNSS